MLGSAFGASVFDKRAIDGMVDGTASTVRGVGGAAARLQTGRLQDYLAGAVILGLGVFVVVWYFG